MSKSKVKVKVCGLRRDMDIEYANELMSDYVGFIFYKPKFRYITFDEAARLRGLLNPKIDAVGVFVDEPVENVISLLNGGVIQMAQLHGHESEDYIKQIKESASGDVMQVSLVKSREDVTNAMCTCADYVLIDAGLGDGEIFDWDIASGIDLSKRVFVAGGLGPDNVGEAVRRLNPYGVDASSSLEINKYKDFELMKKFIDEARGV